MIGQTLAHFEILEKLGEGGMGVVYKARDTHLDRLVAIKLLPPDKVADRDRRLRFVQEAKTASALNHPGIVTIHDIAEQEHGRIRVLDFGLAKLVDRPGLPAWKAGLTNTHAALVTAQGAILGTVAVRPDGFLHRRSDVRREVSLVLSHWVPRRWHSTLITVPLGSVRKNRRTPHGSFVSG
jgi:hypothetical protein